MRLYDFTRSQLQELLVSWRFPATHARALWKSLYREAAIDLAAIGGLPTRLRKKLSEAATLDRLPVCLETAADSGETSKYLLGLEDGRQIETVRMRCTGRVTACLSSQAGCALGCVFCATGQAGFGRNLTTGEIVAQALHVARELRQAGAGSLRNVVLMGMGEPLLNYDAVLRAVEILGDSAGMAIAGKRITLSTVGVVPGIVRLADERRPCSLAVSLHAATQDEREALVPAAKIWPLTELMDACRYYTAQLGRKIFFEWTLIAGQNDTQGQAEALVHLVRGLPAQINLIPLNPTGGYEGMASEDEAAARFQQRLFDHGLPTTIRRRRGVGIAAGCGQLAAPKFALAAGNG